MKNNSIDFYFDYVSPYAYFAWIRIQSICKSRNIGLNAHPILFAGLLNKWGHLGPAEIAPKMEWVFKDSYRYAKKHGIDFIGPPMHPFNPLSALRVSLKESSDDKQNEIISLLFHSCWGVGLDISDMSFIHDILKDKYIEAGAICERAVSDIAKDSLKKETMLAIEKGVFGVPSFIIDGELFWGSDRFDDLESFLDGKDVLDKEFLSKALMRPRAIDRKR